MKIISDADRRAQKRADEIFDALDDYSKGCLAQQGTAFTTYEEEGDDVCAWLNMRANSWRSALQDEDDDDPAGRHS